MRATWVPSGGWRWSGRVDGGSKWAIERMFDTLWVWLARIDIV